MNRQMLIAPILLVCTALTAQGAPPTQRPRPAHLAMQQITTEILDSKGEVAGTKREIRITMHDGKGNSWSDNPSTYLVQNAKSEFREVNALRFEKNDRGLTGNPMPTGGSGMMVSKATGKGVLEPKTDEDGIRIVGSWRTQEWPAENGADAYTERVETWYRAAKGSNDELGLLPHREIRTSQYERRTTDWWYMASNRFHPSMFSWDPVVKEAKR